MDPDWHHIELTRPTEVAKSRNSWYSKYSIVSQNICLIPKKCRGFHTVPIIPLFSVASFLGEAKKILAPRDPKTIPKVMKVLANLGQRSVGPVSFPCSFYVPFLGA